ncbi:hypothetical protein L917_17519 [Phytophthora nicotianae]|uniref:Uncharacterized protein n=1 Tax=Phytophthora nicotianae TaxID=4792 RepID=W2KAN7_PHYNI|nr:hypothetical protein L917_17519 [Phytophthora nicotianae]
MKQTRLPLVSSSPRPSCTPLPCCRGCSRSRAVGPPRR